MKRALTTLLVATLMHASVASADESYFFARGRLQGGLVTEARPSRDLINDFHLDAIPEVGLSRFTPTSQLTLTYTLTTAVHTFYSNELGQRLSLAYATELSSRTGLTLGGSVARTTLGNIFLTQPASAGTTGLFPATSTTIVTVNANQGLTHDLSPRWRLDQESTATAFKTLYPAPPSTSQYLSLGGGIERVWQNDGVGVGALMGYSHTSAPPLADSSLLLFSAGPRWRHDWSRTLSSLVEAGASMVKSPTRSTSAYFAPQARASVQYVTDDVTLSVAAVTGITPNPMTGQLTKAHEASAHASTPLSLPKRVFLEGSLGYTWGDLIDRDNPQRNLYYDSLVADASVIWELNSYVETFARYSLMAQGGAAATGADISFVRNSFLVGISISSRPLITRGGVRAGGMAGQGTPQRVDRTDKPAKDSGAAQPDPVNRNAEPTYIPPRDDD